MSTVDPANPTSTPGPGVIAPVPTGPKSAAHAVLQLKRSITSITKDGFNPQGKFAFRGIDQCIDAAGPIERDLGLILVPELLAEETAQHEYGANRTLGFRTRVRVTYTWHHPETGTSFGGGTFPGEAMDSGDKGTAKAMSVALRIMYLQLLTVPTGEPDPDQSTYEVARPESATTDPVEEAKLRDRIQKAGTDATLRSAYDAVLDAFGGDKARITAETRDALVTLVKIRKSEIAAAALTSQQRQSASTNASGIVHPNAPTPDEQS